MWFKCDNAAQKDLVKLDQICFDAHTLKLKDGITVALGKPKEGTELQGAPHYN